MSNVEVKNKKKNENLTSETFRLNKSVAIDAEIIEFLERSHNKTGLIKDAIMMYKELVDSGAYNSPFLNATRTNWGAIFSKLDPAIMLGATPETVKNRVKEDIREMEKPMPIQQAREELYDNDEDYYDDEDDVFGNDDNDAF